MKLFGNLPQYPPSQRDSVSSQHSDRNCLPIQKRAVAQRLYSCRKGDYLTMSEYEKLQYLSNMCNRLAANQLARNMPKKQVIDNLKELVVKQMVHRMAFSKKKHLHFFLEKLIKSIYHLDSKEKSLFQAAVRKQIVQFSQPKKIKNTPSTRRKVSSQLQGKKLVKSSLPGKIKSLEQLQAPLKIKKMTQGMSSIKRHKQNLVQLVNQGILLVQSKRLQRIKDWHTHQKQIKAKQFISKIQQLQNQQHIYVSKKMSDLRKKKQKKI